MVYVTPACSLGLYTGFSTLLYQVVQTWMLVLEFVAGSTGVLELLVAIILYGLIPKSASCCFWQLFHRCRNATSFSGAL